jgi:hypothetical protein
MTMRCDGKRRAGNARATRKMLEHALSETAFWAEPVPSCSRGARPRSTMAAADQSHARKKIAHAPANQPGLIVFENSGLVS